MPTANIVSGTFTAWWQTARGAEFTVGSEWRVLVGPADMAGGALAPGKFYRADVRYRATNGDLSATGEVRSYPWKAR